MTWVSGGLCRIVRPSLYRQGGDQPAAAPHADISKKASSSPILTCRPVLTRSMSSGQKAKVGDPASCYPGERTFPIRSHDR